MKNSLPKGPLLEPLPPLQLGLLTPGDENAAKIAARVSLEYEKLELLAEHLNIPPGPSRWYQLSLELARHLVPGLNEAKPIGRPKKWGMVEKGALFVEIERRTNAGMNQEEAARAISKLEPWASFVESWSPGKATTGSDPAEALLAEYKNARKHFFAEIAWNAFLFHEHEGTLDKWNDFIVSAVGTSTKSKVKKRK